ncbi:tetratricopeptide repeat protein [Kordiimonas aquimaris]|uniref:tetratricopeptide repeat protein n=1 Tax=Kordiimonas aquimaris TaxID=707591 RepID=UPI0021CE4A1F|nr:SPOR domain-containing protein [Kordiimonas aquimaris]
MAAKEDTFDRIEMMIVLNIYRAAFFALFFSFSVVAQTSQPIENSTAADELSVNDALEDIRNGDIEKGMGILESLGRQANPTALFHLAEMARIGIGRDKSIPIATMYYRMSGQLGNEAAALKLANILYFDGTGSEAELAEAVSVWQTYALKGNPEAAYVLGTLYWNGEVGSAPDPVRGYGLVWRAAQTGYNPAEQAELSMRAQMNGAARSAGEAYGKALETEGFGGGQLALELLIDGYSGDTDGEGGQNPAEKPEDWAKVWRLEVGFAMDDAGASELLERIRREEAATVKDLYGEVIKSPNRVGMYRLVFGPVNTMNDAVSMCVVLKRAGHDCFAQPPTADDVPSES